MTGYAAVSSGITHRYVVLHSIFAFFHALTYVGGMALVVSEDISVSTDVYLIRQERTVDDPTVKRTGELNGVWILSFAPLVSCFGHLFVAMSTSPITAAPIMRYIDYSISSTLMIFTVAILTGLCDALQITFICVMQVVLCLLGTVNGGSPREAMVPAALSTLLHVTIWASLFSVLTLNLDGDTQWVNAIMVTLFALFSMFALVRYLELAGRIDVHQADQGFLILSAVAKNFLQWSLLGGLRGMEETSETNSLTVYYIVLGSVTAFSLILVCVVRVVSRRFAE